MKPDKQLEAKLAVAVQLFKQRVRQDLLREVREQLAKDTAPKRRRARP